VGVASRNQEVQLHRVLRLAHTSHRRFATLEMTIRGWEDVERIIEAQEVDRDGAEVQEPRESLIRMWIDRGSSGVGGRAVWRPRRYRVEAGDVVMVSDLPRWWVVDRSQGTVRSWEQAAPGVSGADDIADPWFHFPDVSWLKRWRGVAVRGMTEVVGRPAVLVAARNTMIDIIPGSDRMLLALDLERGVLLRAECFLGDALLGVEEVVEIAFDRPLSDDLFEQPGLQEPS
jgi:hypothetical protein